MSGRLVVTEQFERALESMSEHYLSWATRFGDAGARLDRFLHALGSEVIPLLQAHPGIGSLHRIERNNLDAKTVQVLGIEKARAGRPLRTRRWPHGEFQLLYAELDSALVLISAKHQRQGRFF